MDGVRYVELRPPPPLRPLAWCVWVLEGDGPAPSGVPQRVLPDGRVELVVHLRAAFRRTGPDGVPVAPHPRVVAGQLSQAILLAPTGPFTCVGLRLEPAGARALLGGRADALADAILPMDDALGAAGARLADALACARDDAARAAAAWAWLAREAAAGRPSRTDVAIARWRGDGGRASVEEMACAVGTNRRGLERAFASEVGLTPKRFARIVRLQRAAATLRGPRAPDLAVLAQTVGCCDQAHLTREFTDLCGVPPSRWLAEENDVGGALVDREGTGPS